MYILAFFTDSGVPKTGLSCEIKIRDIPSGSILVNNLNMSELGDGFYYYDFTAYDATKDYAILCDGSATLSNTERYLVAGNENYLEDISENTTLKRIVGLLHENFYIDSPVYDTFDNLISSRVRIYSDAASVGTDNNVIGTYDIVSDSDAAGKFNTWKQVKV